MKAFYKFFFISIIFTFLILPVTHAQDGWNFGLNGGINTSWINAEVVTGDPIPGEFGSRVSYTAGLYGEYGINERMFFQLGFNIDQRGFKYKETEGDKSVDITAKAPYFDIPILFRYAFVKKQTFGLYALLGPSFGFLVGGKIKGERSVNGEIYTIDEKLEASHQSSDLGIKMGLGAEFPFVDDKGAIFFDVRYNWGVTDNIRQAGYYESVNVDANSNVVSVIIGVKGYIE